MGVCESAKEANSYLVQEFIDSRNLAQELASSGAFSEGQIRTLLNDLLPVLQFVHQLPQETSASGAS